MRFGEKLKRLRQESGMTQAELAKVSGVPIGTIRDYEQVKRYPLLPTAFKLAAALGTTCEAFADCEDIGGDVKGKAGKRKRK